MPNNSFKKRSSSKHGRRASPTRSSRRKTSFSKDSKNKWEQPPTGVKPKRSSSKRSARKRSNNSKGCSKKQNIELAFTQSKLGKQLGKGTYITQSNGGACFVVDVKADIINIYDVKYHDVEEGDQYVASKHVYCTTYKSVMIGKDQRYKGFLGSAILIEVDDCSYVYVCERILSFKTKSPITMFYLNIGNSAVPYPYAVDQDNNGYALGITHKTSVKSQRSISVVEDRNNEFKRWSIEDPHMAHFNDHSDHKVTKCKAHVIATSSHLG